MFNGPIGRASPLTECRRCGSQILYEDAPHECPTVALRFEASEAYHEDKRRQRYEEFRLGQFVDLAMVRIGEGMDPREAVERAVDAACQHGRVAGVANRSNPT